MQAIQTVTVGSGGASSIEFSSIPDTYTDLKLVVSLRSNRTGGATEIVLIKFNGVSTDLSTRWLQGEGSGSPASATATTGRVGIANGGTSTSNTFTSAEITIPNYAGAANKSFSTDMTQENNATEAYQVISAGLWSSTAAITSIEILPADGPNWVEHSTATLYGIKSTAGSGAPKATGGMISYDAANNKWVHVFTASGTFTPTEDLTCEYLVIAGGGAGGSSGYGAGGGGGGGYRSSVSGESSGGGGSAESSLTLDAATGYTVTIGAGGSGITASSYNTAKNNGTNSEFATITSTSGGGGSGGNVVGSDGGSGGGGDGGYSTVGGDGTSNQGRNGGQGIYGNPSVEVAAGGGGGGASTNGTSASISGSVASGGNGGNGVASSITGSSVTRAGGGGGGSYQSATPGNGGLGGGGNGAQNDATNGTISTGSGGGGSGNSGISVTSGSGGSGIVIVRYSA
jgi:hypothetical protein